MPTSIATSLKKNEGRQGNRRFQSGFENIQQNGTHGDGKNGGPSRGTEVGSAQSQNDLDKWRGSRTQKLHEKLVVLLSSRGTVRLVGNWCKVKKTLKGAWGA